MKKLGLWVVMAAAVVGLYLYINQEHRNIQGEESSFVLSAAILSREFALNPEAAHHKYSDKVIEVSGPVTETDQIANTILIDGKIHVNLIKEENLADLKYVTVKGRFLGYDDLLDEFRLDQAAILK